MFVPSPKAQPVKYASSTLRAKYHFTSVCLSVTYVAIEEPSSVLMQTLDSVSLALPPWSKNHPTAVYPFHPMTVRCKMQKHAAEI